MGILGIFYFAIAGQGAFIERIGGTTHVGLETIGLAIFVGQILTIIGPIAAGVVGARVCSNLLLMLVGGLICTTVFGHFVGLTGTLVRTPM